MPPTITGVDFPYDPASSIWKSLESSQQGSFKILGKDVDIHRLWTLVLQHGGSTKARLFLSNSIPLTLP